MCKKLFNYILNDPVLQFSQTGYRTVGISSRCCRIVFDSEILTLSCRGVIEETQQSKMLINLHSSQSKTANNFFMYVDTIMIFGGILDSVWPNNNQNESLLCDLRCQSKDGITEFFTRLHYSIYEQSQVEDVVLQVTHHCII